MGLTVGARLGPYEVLAPLGAGGMGEVFRARDTRLGRDVAVKVLPDHLAGDPKALHRFEVEAKAVAALSHPNILSLFDVGETNGTRYAVTELLEGETLRAFVLRGPVPLKRALEIAQQVAEALAAAHAKGIVHRDVKPENVFLTKDGRAKVLDFGLARHETSFRAPDNSHSPTLSALTEAGAVVGTVAYMSPEQARGLPVDHRSDQFSLGVVLYEMLAGRRPFRGATAADVLTVIIRDEPEPLSRAAPSVPAPVRWIVERCLAKEPDGRYDSTRDLAREIAGCRGHLSEAPATGGVPAPGVPASGVSRRRRGFHLAVLVGAIAAAAVAGLLAGRRLSEQPTPCFKKLTFFSGRVGTARFTPDGSGVVYGRRVAPADYGMPDHGLFSTRVDGPVSFPLEPRSATGVVGVHGGEMAILSGGSLALVPLGGGTPREVRKDVVAADWSPDGRSFTVVRDTGPMRHLEFPAGKVLFETAGVITSVRISPDGARVAFGHLPHRSTWGATVCVAGRAGPVQTLSEGWDGVSGVAWSPFGTEVWFAAGRIWGWSELHAVDLEGRRRTLLPTHAVFELKDVRRDGAVLLGAGWLKNESWGTPPGETGDRNVSWLDATGVLGITADGSATLHYETSLGGGEGQSGYLRRSDGSSPIRLGAGKFFGLSRDGHLALARDSGNVLHVVPTGPGERRSYPWGARATILSAEFFPGDERVLVLASEPGRPYRLFVQDLASGSARPLGPEGVEIAIPGRPVSPDGQLVAAFRAATPFEPVFVEVASGTVRPIPGLSPGDKPLAWGADGQTLFVRAFVPGRSDGLRARWETVSIDRLDLRTGKRRPWRELSAPAGGSGVSWIIYDPAISEDGRAFFYTVLRGSSDLWLVEGLR
jgi:eukaryotic-like serine/threonine-protein kinase